MKQTPDHDRKDPPDMTHHDTNPDGTMPGHVNGHIVTQAEPPQVATATLALARVLAGDLPVDTRLAVAGALAVLNDVHPPYPPHPEVLDPLDVVTGVGDALAALHAFLAESGGVADVIRAGLAARELTAVTASAAGGPR
jgi:hypothetical protein